MKFIMPKKLFSAASLVSLLSLMSFGARGETVLDGNHKIVAGNGDDGSLWLEEGTLIVGGTIEAYQGLWLGDIATGHLGGFMSYQGGFVKTIFMDLDLQDGSFVWRDMHTTTMAPKMSLDGNNVLSLYKSDNTGVGITFNPNTGAVTAAGVPLATQSYTSSAISSVLGASIGIAGGSALDYRSVGLSGGYASGVYSTAASGGSASEAYSVGLSEGSASGASSTALSTGRAGGTYAVAGSAAEAVGDVSTAFSGGRAEGGYSFAVGLEVTAGSLSSVALGRYNVLDQMANPAGWVETDTLFSVGNGTGTQNNARSSAISILKNGRTSLVNKHWNSQLPLATPANASASSSGNALVVDGHAVLNGKVTISQPQGDINMGIYQ